MAKKPAPEPDPNPDDWRAEIAKRRGVLVNRLFVLTASDDEATAMKAITTLLELDTKEAPPAAPSVPMFTLPANTAVDLGVKKETH